MKRFTRARALVTALMVGGATAGLALAQPAIPPGGAVDPNGGTVDPNGGLEVAPVPEARAPAEPPLETLAERSEPSDAELEREMQQRLRALSDTLDDLLSIPETPAAFAIGTTGEAVARPGTLRDAALEVVSLYDADGDLKPGFSGEFAPFRILNEDATIDEWLKNANLGRQILDSVRLSLATAKDPAGTGSDAPVLVSLGFRLSFLDDRDYRQNREFVSAVRQALQTCFPSQVEASGEGIFGGPGFTAVAPDDACAAARRERALATRAEAALREKLSSGEQDSRRKEAALLVAQSARDQAKARRTEQEAVVRRLEGYAAADPARANALGPVLEGARVELEAVERAAADAEAKASAVERELQTELKALESARAEHARVNRALAQASSKLEAMNDAGDFQRLEHDLEAEYLTRGSRLELAFASVLTDRGIGDGGARFRQARGWLAYEYSFGTAALGAAADLALLRGSRSASVTDDATLLGSDDTLVDGRFGARVNFAAGSVDAGLAGGLAVLQDRSDAAEYGGTVELKFTALGAARTGLFVRTPFDGAPSELIAILALSTASGESLFKRAHSANLTPKE